MRYFAYGSNLCVPRLEKRGAEPSNPRVAVLQGFALRFNKRSNDGSAKANIVAGHPASIVWGVVFDIHDHNLHGLREAEGHPTHYSEEEVHVVLQDEVGKLTAIAYVARPEKIVDDLPPYGWYVDHVLMGARAFGFPEDYLELLAQVHSTEDPDRENDAIERAYWMSR